VSRLRSSSTLGARTLAALGAGAALALLPPAAAAQQAGVTAVPDSVVARVDGIFTFAKGEAPGCAVGVSKDGRPLLTRAYGMANLEYGVPITPETVFESGSVAKQFTAAALVLLAQDGKLSLDDDIRKYLPEVPSFGGQKITIRHLLTHTSGLRDQWGLLGLLGRGPGTQVHSPATTVDLVKHQRDLNFPVGSEHLYSNTGYTLAGEIVARVSGKSLDAFSQERLFKPLGMTKTQWRDDHTEIVKNRATAYAGSPSGFRTNMSFTNITGNGGLLTTVGDWLTWNAQLDEPTVLGRALVDSLLVRGRLTNGRTIPYALGLVHGEYAGVKEISHGGSTAGYQTYLTRFPEQRLSVAMLCNGSGINPTAVAYRVADLFLVKPPRAQAAQAGWQTEPAVTLAPAQAERWAGIYRAPRLDAVLALAARNGGLVPAANPNAAAMVPLAPDRFRMSTAANVLSFAGPAGRRTVRMVSAGGDTTDFVEVAPADTARLADYAGTYRSPELELDVTLSVKDGRLTLFRRPADTIALTPLYKDGFQAQGAGTFYFTRDARGRVNGFEITAGRVRHVKFEKR
jgi:CubicO group peptidase (beta-lactamase class C family)